MQSIQGDYVGVESEFLFEPFVINCFCTPRSRVPLHIPPSDYSCLQQSTPFLSFEKIKGLRLTKFSSIAQNEPQVEVPTSPTEPTRAGGETRKRPRLDFSAALGGRERKRGKSMFGLLVGTLNKAKSEDKERNASEAVSFVRVYLLYRSTKMAFHRQKNDN